MMKEDIKTQWVTALRSGEYLQGQNRLVEIFTDSPERHCCLGVLCELAVAAGVTTKQDTPRGVVFGDGDRNYLPIEVQEWAGLDSQNPTVSHEGAYNLASLNDDGKSFEHIADVIEEQL